MVLAASNTDTHREEEEANSDDQECAVVLREVAERPQGAWPGTGAQPLAYLAG